MHLGEYLDYHDIQVEQFASEIEVHRSTVYRFVRGGSFPRPSILRRIIEVTDGWVTADDMNNHYLKQKGMPQ